MNTDESVITGPVGEVYILAPFMRYDKHGIGQKAGGVSAVRLFRDLPAGTKLYTAALASQAAPDAICEHDWRPITEPHKCCEKCGDVRRDWNAPVASKEAVTLIDKDHFVKVCFNFGIEARVAANMWTLLAQRVASKAGNC